MKLTEQQARRVAVRATGLDHTTRARPDRVDVRHFRRVLSDVDVVQLDSVNVVDRAHRLLFAARLGPHDRQALDDWLWRSRDAHECWAHVASVMAMDAWPLLAHRRTEHETHPWKGAARAVAERPEYVRRVLELIDRQGPTSVSDLDDTRSGDSYWGWGPGKIVLHWLALSGRTATDHRDGTFKSAYDLAQRVVPSEVFEAPAPPTDEAVVRLALRAVRAQGVATAASAADHHRQPVRAVTTALRTLERAGEVVPVEVDCLRAPAWTTPDLVVPRRVRARALVAPFDPLVWFRRRTERLFDMHYRIEIYVPRAKREYGYYVLPFLLDDQLVGRVDLKSDRRAGRLLVKGAWAQPGQDHVRVARELAAELRDLATHVVHSDEVAVADNGDLAGALAAAVDA